MEQIEMKLENAVKMIRERTNFRPRVAVVLGSGLGKYAEKLNKVAEISYSELPGFPVSTVAGHDGKFLFGTIEDVPVVMMSGRVHYYEGYDMQEVVMPIRVMGLLGVEVLVLTNAAGAVNTAFQPGEFMMITDHISAFVPSPLRGPNLEKLGPRFPDMSHVYDPELCAAMSCVADGIGIRLNRGVYLQWQGPTYETPAEIRMFRALGADAVGMSTACEAIAAKHMGMRVCGVSCLTNMAAGILDQPLDHREVQEIANKVGSGLEQLVTGLIREYGKEGIKE